MEPPPPTAPVIADAEAARALFAALADEPVEVAEAVYLGPEWRICGRSRFSGTPGSVAVSIRRLVSEALAADAARVLLAHNHPSGDARASAEDIRFTRTLAYVLAALDMPLADHLIATTGGIVSMRQRGLL